MTINKTLQEFLELNKDHLILHGVTVADIECTTDANVRDIIYIAGRFEGLVEDIVTFSINLGHAVMHTAHEGATETVVRFNGLSICVQALTNEWLATQQIRVNDLGWMVSTTLRH